MNLKSRCQVRVIQGNRQLRYLGRDSISRRQLWLQINLRTLRALNSWQRIRVDNYRASPTRASCRPLNLHSNKIQADTTIVIGKMKRKRRPQQMMSSSRFSSKKRSSRLSIWKPIIIISGSSKNMSSRGSLRSTDSLTLSLRKRDKIESLENNYLLNSNKGRSYKKKSTCMIR